jgi:type I restriction-modification system DNA methylase subunit
MDNPHSKELIDLLKIIAEKHGIHETFTAFLELSALAVSNRFNLKQFEEREKRYLEIAGKYSKEEMDVFSQMLSTLMKALHYETGFGTFQDFLGDVYHTLGLHNKWKAQFFSPMSVCNMMGQISLGEPPYETHITLQEPCVGSGAMVLGFVNAMISHKLNWTSNLTVKAIDSDEKCVHMAFLQFSLYGIPAIVTHGNTLTLEEWSHWYTPMYFIRL